MERTNDVIELCGTINAKPELSHKSRDEEYYKFPLAVKRLSGTEDVVNILLRKEQLEELEIAEKPRLRIFGEVRSFNNRSGVGARLIITVLARTLEFTDDDYENSVRLTGNLCKEPNLRRTPMGREICDLMLAVNRNYGRTDYLPCIAWGSAARSAATWDVGTEVSITGRLQSRSYIKLEDSEALEKTAYEISAITIEKL